MPSIYIDQETYDIAVELSGEIRVATKRLVSFNDVIKEALIFFKAFKPYVKSDKNEMYKVRKT
jgi:hypothetical protein